MKKPELLAPAGNSEKLKIAFAYGADAVYLGGQLYSLRAGAGNFSHDEMASGIEFAHRYGKKVYVTINIFAHNHDLVHLPAYLKKLADLGVDGLIISDPGIILLAKELNLGLKIHLSTQANTTNWASIKLWQTLGVSRVVLARELAIQEIKEIKKRAEIEIEAFVHGAMCMAYSGRCLLSSYWTGRSANRGACTHPCRWRYSLVEGTRTGELLPIEEDERGTYILSSKDLAMIHHIPELAQLGLTSWKIEGRMKSIHYVATVIKVYREALDQFWEKREAYQFDPLWHEELMKVSDRGFTTGFYFNEAKGPQGAEKTTKEGKVIDFVGIVLNGENKGEVLVEQRNFFKLGDKLELLQPQGENIVFELGRLLDEGGLPLEAARHPQQKVYIEAPVPLAANTLLRRYL
ncbi:MAG: U32 family peptidase [Bacillota bacterium]